MCMREALMCVCGQVSDDANVMLNGFGTVVNSLKMRAKPYLPQICGTIKWRLNNKSAKIRQQAADLIARIAVVMKARARARRKPVYMSRGVWIESLGLSVLYLIKHRSSTAGSLWFGRRGPSLPWESLCDYFVLDQGWAAISASRCCARVRAHWWHAPFLSACSLMPGLARYEKRKERQDRQRAWLCPVPHAVDVLMAGCCAQACDEEKLLGHLGVVLYEYLGEEYPEVLGSILGALKSIVNVIGMTKARAQPSLLRGTQCMSLVASAACLRC